MYNKILIILFLFSHISYTYSEFSVYLNGDVFQFSGTNFPYTDSKFKFYGDESLIAITDDIHVDDDISSNSGYNLQYLHNDECIKYQYQHLKIKDQRGNEILLNEEKIKNDKSHSTHKTNINIQNFIHVNTLYTQRHKRINTVM